MFIDKIVTEKKKFPEQNFISYIALAFIIISLSTKMRKLLKKLYKDRTSY